MKILLINPSIDFFSRPLEKFYRRFFPTTFIPLGILYLASVAEDMGFDVIVKSVHHSNFKKIIKKIKPDLLGITCSTPQYNQAIKIAQITKCHDKNIVTLLGGYFPTFRWKQILAETNLFDYIVIGEGEITFREFLKNFNEKSKIEKIKGLAFKKDNKIVFTGNRKLIKKLDSLPFPARHLLDYPIPIVLTSRGCPYNCKFCAIKNFYNRLYRKRSIENVVKEISLLRKENYKKIHIRDDNFCIDKNYIIKFCKLIKKKELDHVEFAINGDIKAFMDDGVLKLLKEINVKTLRVGIQSTNDEFRKYMNLPFDYDLVKKFFEKIKKHDFIIHCFFIVNSGKSNENIEMIKDNIDEFYNLISRNSDGKAKFSAHLHILDPYPGTDIEKDFLDRGVKIELGWSLYRAYYCNYKYNDVNRETLEPLFEESIERFLFLKNRKLIKKLERIIMPAVWILLSDISFKIKLRIFFDYIDLRVLKRKSDYKSFRFIYEKYF